MKRMFSSGVAKGSPLQTQTVLSLKGLATLIYCRAACFMRYFLILSFLQMILVPLPSTWFLSRDNVLRLLSVQLHYPKNLK